MESDESHQESAESGDEAGQDQDQPDTENLEDNPDENQNLEAEDDPQNVALVENQNSEAENSRDSMEHQNFEKSDTDQGVHDIQEEGEDNQVIHDVQEEEERERESTISGMENSKPDDRVSLGNEDKNEDGELSGMEAKNEPLGVPGAFDDAVVSDSLDTSMIDSKNVEQTTPQQSLATKNEELFGWEATDDSLGKPGVFNDALSDSSEIPWLDSKNVELTLPQLSPTAKTTPFGQSSWRRSTRFQNQGDNLPADTSLFFPPLAWDGRSGTAQMHQWSYRPVSRFLRNPFYTRSWTCPKMYCGPGQGLTTTRYAGADKKKTRPERRWAREYSVEDRSVPAALSNPNPAATVPMAPRKWKKMTWMAPPEATQEWKVNAEKEKAKKDHQKAQKQGYETLVGNIIYHDIPGAKDLNRSWKHFLDPDPMAWGFPYAKGSTERPCLPLPGPYLVHQMKEQLWKWPRNKLISQNTPSVSRVPSAGIANTSKTELNNQH